MFVWGFFCSQDFKVEWWNFDSAGKSLSIFRAYNQELTHKIFVFPCGSSRPFLTLSLSLSSVSLTRPPTPQTETPVCASDKKQWEHFLHQGPVPGTSCGLHQLAGHLLPGEEVCQQCCCGAEHQERYWGHSQTHPGEQSSTTSLIYCYECICPAKT